MPTIETASSCVIASSRLYSWRSYGHQKDFGKVRNSDYYWPRMRQFVHDYVLACDVCEERKNPPQKKRSQM